MAGEDQAVALYGLAKKQLESMNQREAELQSATADLQAAVDDLKGLPLALGKQTGQYIGMAVRKSIQEDFSLPIETAVKAPLANLSSAIYQAREVIKQVGDQSDAHRWRGMAMLIVFGLFAGMIISYFFFIQRLGDIDARLNVLQQQRQAAPPAPAAEQKQPSGNGKGHHGR